MTAARSKFGRAGKPLAIFGDIGSVFVMGLFAAGFTVPTLIIPRILAPHNPNPIKNAAFECGQVPQGKGKMHFMMQYYAYLLMFVVFDVMAMFLYAWAVAYQPLALGQLSSWLMVVFVGALLLPMGLTVHMAGRREMW
jgi:NADH-quinone oxidoreductase subunit A